MIIPAPSALISSSPSPPLEALTPSASLTSSQETYPASSAVLVEMALWPTETPACHRAHLEPPPSPTKTEELPVLALLWWVAVQPPALQQPQAPLQPLNHQYKHPLNRHPKHPLSPQHRLPPVLPRKLPPKLPPKLLPKPAHLLARLPPQVLQQVLKCQQVHQVAALNGPSSMDTSASVRSVSVLSTENAWL